MTLTTKVKQALKARAHKIKPIVLIGNNGFTPSVKLEIGRALDDHELIKIRIAAEDRELKRALFNEICHATSAEPIQLIGNIGVIYRKNKDK